MLADGTDDRNERPGIETKACRRCSLLLPFSAFHLHAKTGRPSEAVCKECSKVMRKARHRAASQNGRSEEARARQREADRRFAERNPERRRLANQQAYLRNKEAVNARAMAWRKAHPEYGAAKAAERRGRGRAAGAFTPADVLALLKLQKGRCVVCRCDIRKGYTVDHIVPLKRGGGNERTNIQLLCQSCNSTKNAKDPIDFMQQRGLLL